MYLCNGSIEHFSMQSPSNTMVYFLLTQLVLVFTLERLTHQLQRRSTFYFLNGQEKIARNYRTEKVVCRGTQ